ncbi:MAG TPA: SCO6880 family protein, partial [Marmoricola sp.]
VGLGLGQLVTLAGALLIAVTGVYSSGAAGLVVSSALWLPLVAIATVKVGGRTVLAWVPIAASWRSRALVGSTREFARPVTAVGLHVPGVAGDLRVIVTPTLGAALIHDRRTDTVTAIARVAGSGFTLDAPATQSHKVDSWGRALASLGQQRSVRRVQVLLRTVPNGEAGVRRWWRGHAAADAPFASSVLADLLDDAYYLTRRPEALVVLALRSPRRGARRISPDAAARLEQDLLALVDALAAADLSVDEWVSPVQLSGVLRTSYDPARSPSPTGEESAGPPSIGTEEHWRYLRTDSAVHATYWISEWPRSEVNPAFLQPLVLSPGVHRTITLVAEPLPIAAALREIRRAKAEHAADAAQRLRIGQVEDEATRAEVEDLVRREQELVAGHGDMRFTGLVTVTAPTLDELDAACAATEAAAAQSLCEVRRLVGQQGLAHLAGAVPLARGVL